MSLSTQELQFYSRQIVLPELGIEGQEKLKAARVLAIGAGGLGSPLLMYLAGAGIGTLGIVDFDCVEPSNLHRQIMHRHDRVDMPKTQSALLTLRAINPHVEFIVHEEPIGHANAEKIIAGYDIVADGSDNFATRDCVHAACMAARIPLVSAAVQLTSGVITTFKAHLGPPHPCFRCLYPQAPGDGFAPSCSEIGVLGPAVGALGAMQATEVIKEILGVEPSLSGRLMMYDALACDMQAIDLPRRSTCAHCGNTVQPPVTGGNRLISSEELT
jgi:molybdopterin-synthase adenylyltransferase